jgi:uncharacterized protein DUF4007
MQLKFSGHETFVCRTFWPKKGYDYLDVNKSFTDIEATTELGVGKNMVSSIAFWLKAMGLSDIHKQPTSFAKEFLSNTGYDPFLEDIGSIWLLHANLIKNGYASLYDIVFNEFRRNRSTFNKTQLFDFVKSKYSELNSTGYNSSTIEKDISVFCRTYNQPDYLANRNDFEEEVVSLFLELEIMTSTKEKDLNGKIIEWFSIESNERHNLPPEIVFYYILETYKNEHSIAFRRLHADNNSPGIVFSLNKEGLYKKLKQLESLFKGTFLSETAGNIILVIPEEITPRIVLSKYYED